MLLGRELVAFQDDIETRDSRLSSRRGETLLSRAGSGDTAILDDSARRELERRRQEIRNELDLAKESRNREKQLELEDESIQISKQLETGPRGQRRRDNSPQEKARKAAQRQYSRALAFLTEHNLDRLREHLKGSITSGLSVIYRPQPDVDWLT